MTAGRTSSLATVLLAAIGWGMGSAPAAAAPADTVRVLVVYHSETGNTEAMARGVAEGAASVAGTAAQIVPVTEVTREQLLSAHAIALGSPTWFGNMSGPMKAFIDGWWLRDRVYLGDKVGGAFATGGGMYGGKEHVVTSLILAMLGNGMIIAGPVFELGEERFGNAGPAAATAPPYDGVGPDELEGARQLGRRLALVAQRLGATP
jgi:NAD(P)H dehydrogenase (quinone)